MTSRSSPASMCRFDNIMLRSPSRCRSRIRRSGSAAKAGPALRRTAQLGDAWYPIGTNPAFPLDSLARFKAQVARLRKMTQEAGRDPKAVGARLRCTALGESVPAKAGDGERRLFSGKPAEIAADIKALRDMGVGASRLRLRRRHRRGDAGRDAEVPEGRAGAGLGSSGPRASRST